jgi:translation initiation factor IF-3
MEVVGVVKRVEATKVVGTNGFEIRDIIVTTEEQYPQTLAIQFVQGKVVELDKFAAGEKVKISINLRGRESNNKEGQPVVYNTIQGWKIDKAI